MKYFAHPDADEATPVDISKLLSDTLIVAGHELNTAGEVKRAGRSRARMQADF